MAGSKIDPFDVPALEKSLNDSATRVSAIWVSYLVFGLYLVIAAGNVTHRQLFLEEPIKLPVLNIDLPLLGFFVLAPLLFVIFHTYVLIQVLLLARTADTYNEGVEQSVALAVDRARVRQRLANTLFAQIFAGSPRERDGLLGWMLRLMAWTTLAIAPVFVLLAFEVKSLPHHSHLVTWALRVLVALDLLAVLLLWPGALDPRHEIAWRGLVRHWRASLAALLLVLCASVLISFPGEPQAGWTRYAVTDWRTPHYAPPECHTKSIMADVLFANFDRLSLPSEDVVDDDKLAKIEGAANAKRLDAFEGERTRSFRRRDLRCGVFDRADLRRADFAGADLTGASLSRAELQGAILDQASLAGANLFGAQLQNSSLRFVRLQGANLASALLQGSYLTGALAQGADLTGAQLQGSSLLGADLRGATLSRAQLQATALALADLQGADLVGTQLEAATLYAAQLQGANLSSANLQGADLRLAQLQGAQLRGTRLRLALIANAFLWRSGATNCRDAQVIWPQQDNVLHVESFVPREIEGSVMRFRGVGTTPEAVAGFIERIVSDMPEPSGERLRSTLRERFTASGAEESISPIQPWSTCAAAARPDADYAEAVSKHYVEVVCRAEANQNDIARGMMQNPLLLVTEELPALNVLFLKMKRLIDASNSVAHMIINSMGRDGIPALQLGPEAGRVPPAEFPLSVVTFSRGLLDVDPKTCPGAAALNEKTRDKLRSFATAPHGIFRFQ